MSGTGSSHCDKPVATKCRYYYCVHMPCALFELLSFSRRPACDDLWLPSWGDSTYLPYAPILPCWVSYLDILPCNI